MTLCERCQAEIQSRPRFPVEELGCHFTLYDRKFLNLLYSRRVVENGDEDRWVTADSFRALVYSDKPDDPPPNTTFSVYICKLRRKLRGSRWRIETGPHGTFSYRLVEGSNVAEDW